MPTALVLNTGAYGVVADQPAQSLPSNAFTEARNAKFADGRAFSAYSGVSSTFGDQIPLAVRHVLVADSSFWLTFFAGTTAVPDPSALVNTDKIALPAGFSPEYQEASRPWSGGNFHGIEVIHNGKKPVSFTGATFASLTNFPSALNCRVLRPYRNFLFALNLEDAGTFYPSTIQWSNSADAGSLPPDWDWEHKIPGTLSGRAQLPDAEASPILDGLQLRDLFFVYTSTATFLVRFFGGTFVFQLQRLFDFGAISTGAVATANTNQGDIHVVGTHDDLRFHNGGGQSQSVLDGRMRRWFQEHLNPESSHLAFVRNYPTEREVWYFFPAGNATYPNRAIVWNWLENTLSVRHIPETADGLWAAVSLDSDDRRWNNTTGAWEDSEAAWNTPRRIASKGEFRTVNPVTRSGLIYGEETYSDTLIERRSLLFTDQPETGGTIPSWGTVKFFQCLRPQITGNPVEITVGVQNGPNEEPVWGLPMRFDPDTQKLLTLDASGVGFCIRFQSIAMHPFHLYGFEVDYEVTARLNV